MSELWTPDSLTSALDVILVDAGFQDGQTGLPPGFGREPESILYCIGSDDFARRWPLIAAAAINIEPDRPGACVDLTFFMDASHRLLEIDLEGNSLHDVLRAMGRHESASELAAQEGRPVRDALPVIERTLRALFGPEPTATGRAE